MLNIFEEVLSLRKTFSNTEEPSIEVNENFLLINRKSQGKK